METGLAHPAGWLVHEFSLAGRAYYEVRHLAGTPKMKKIYRQETATTISKYQSLYQYGVNRRTTLIV